MAERPEGADEEVERLRRCLNDLISAVALPAIWKGGGPVEILRTLLDAVLGMLDLDFAFARLVGGAGRPRVEMLRSARSGLSHPEQVSRALEAHLGQDPRRWPQRVRRSVADDDLTVVPILLGHDGEIGVIVAASAREDFPQETERLVLTVAANEAAIGLHQALLLREQKRLAEELDQRVARRTAELAEANVELRREIVERKRAERQLAGEKRLLEMVASAYSLANVLDVSCRFVEEMGGDCQCGACLVDWGGPRIELAIFPGLPPSFGEALGALPLNSKASPWGAAACDNRRVIAEDVESDPLWQASAFRRLASEHEIRSCCATPISSSAGAVLGVTVLLWRRPGRPGALHEDLIAQLTQVASIAIERARDEAALRQSEAVLAEGQRLSGTGTFSWPTDGGEITWSEQLYRIFEFDRTLPVTLEAILSRVHPDDRAAFERIMRRASEGSEDFEFEHRLRMPDQSVKHVHVSARRSLHRHGRHEYIGAVQDVTEARLADQALERLRAELARVSRITTLGALTASIAHEVNQPLSGVITNASTCVRMLDADPPNVAGARETARRMIRDGNRAAQVVARLRALFANTDSVACDDVDLNDATREVLALTQTELRGNRVVVRTGFGDNLAHVTGDRIQLQQVIVNLLRNASEAMSDVQDRPRELLIRTEADGADHVRLSVHDTGPGLPDDVMERLFDAFFTTKTSGMGIGLAISRSIVETHQGRLWAINDPGGGAIFYLSLPCRHDSAAAAVSLGVNRDLASRAP